MLSLSFFALRHWLQQWRHLHRLRTGATGRSQRLSGRSVPWHPTYIVIALGTNDYYGEIPIPDVASNAMSYIRVSKYLPRLPITVISPFGNISADYNAAIADAAQGNECHYINGTTLIGHTAASWNKDMVHPSSTGFAEITAALTPILQEKLS